MACLSGDSSQTPEWGPHLNYSMHIYSS